jgi:hypothetical protein
MLGLSACLDVNAATGTLGLLVVVSGTRQTIPLNATAIDPLVVGAYNQYGTPIPGLVVTWAITQGSGTLTVASSTTDISGTAETSFKPGTTTGPVTITATAQNLTLSFTETVVDAQKGL